jgi:hypothetical protein
MTESQCDTVAMPSGMDQDVCGGGDTHSAQAM